MNPLFRTATLIALITFANLLPWKCHAGNDSKQIERRVKKVLNEMTLDQKIGQMTELTADCIIRQNGTDYQLDEEKIKQVIDQFQVGSILNAPLTTAQTLEQWQYLIGVLQQRSMEHIGIPCIYGLDQNHGTTYTQGGTLFPQNINMAATFNRTLVRQAAGITAYETRAGSCPWTYSPTLDLGRDPRWPRLWENYGEDSYLSGQMAAEAVRGFQGDDPNHVDHNHIAACLKHYMGYGVPRTGKDRTPAYISPQDLRERFFTPYMEAVRAGALSVMVNSGSINGMPVHASWQLLTKWLKKDLNWDGLIVSDWADIENLYKREKIAADKKEAIKLAINAGIDISMDPYSTDFCTLLKELVQEKQVSMERINDAVSRILRLKLRLGLFDEPTQNYKDYPLFGGTEHAQKAKKAAEESMILLKNNNAVLPIAEGTKILVTGPNANSMRCLNGGWSYTWQGEKTDTFAEKYNTVYEALSQKFGTANVTLECGVKYASEGAYWKEDASEINKAVKAAEQADLIVACIGENSYCETPGNLDDLSLSANQAALIEALSKTEKPIVLILNEGRPRLISSIEPLVKAVVDILLPGNYGADALADLLAGDANFSGRLPYTYPRYNGGLTTYDYKTTEETDTMVGAYDYNAVVSVQWAFGFGLSYTHFKYANLRVDKSSFRQDDILTFSIDVTNTGNRKGKETVMLFSSDLVASLTPDNRRLRAFEKIELQPGQTQTVRLAIKADDLAFVGADCHWILEKGDFRIQVGDQTTTIHCTQTYHWKQPNKD